MPAALVMQVGPEAARARHLHGGVGDPAVAERPLRMRRKLGQHNARHVVAVQWTSVRALEPAFDAERGRFSRQQQEITCSMRGHGLEPRPQAPASGRRGPLRPKGRRQCVEIVDGVHFRR